MNKKILSFIVASMIAVNAVADTTPVDNVSILVGTNSVFELSTGNTYPAIARPWGMNFWTPVSGEMGNGWTYNYNAYKLRGFKQTHQPSPWINDYGQFVIMPTVGKKSVDETERASWVSHKAEKATPYYYSIYLADYDVTAELAATATALAAAESQLPCPEAQVVESQTIVNGPLLTTVRFSINSAKVSDEEMVNVYNVAEYLKSNPSVNVIICGYADKDTGTAAYNMDLSQRRAQAVYDLLTKTYGIDKNRLSMQAEGSDTQVYKSNDWNRIVIFVPAE